MPRGHKITTTATIREATGASPASVANLTIGPNDHTRPISRCDNPVANIRPREMLATSSIRIRITPRRGARATPKHRHSTQFVGAELRDAVQLSSRTRARDAAGARNGAAVAGRLI